MADGWQVDKRWSDRFLPEIKRILGEYLISEAAQDEDAEHGTDLMVLTLGAVRVGCRVRKPQYIIKYWDEFTIRSARTRGVKTELAKIMEGWGDYFFYGFSDEDESALASWVLGDLKVFRLWFHRQVVSTKVVPGIEIPNHDDSSSFRAFCLSDMPSDFVVARLFVTELAF